ncbi:MAG: DUF357 domain-containing protein [Nitrososphaeria archaeon]
MLKSDEIKKLEQYLENFCYVIKEIKNYGITGDFSRIIEMSERYYYDAKFYFEKGDYFTSLTCIAYAEGLLDSLKLLKIVDFKWPQEQLHKKQKRVLLAGTFDILHPGHIWLIKKAKDYGWLIVLVSTDKNVERLKGRPPILPMEQRVEIVKSLKCVDEVIIGGEDQDILKKVEEIRPDIIILGPDQNFVSENDIKRRFMERGLNVEVIRICEEYKNAKFYKTSQIVNEIIRRKNEFIKNMMK